jgi:septal ring factor EnvC (AmiA/AmiB activator)
LKKIFAILLILSLPFYGSMSIATPSKIDPKTQSTQKRLASLTQSIAKLKQKIHLQKQQEAQALQQLEDTQKKLAQATQRLDVLTKNLADKKKKVEKLNENIHTLLIQQMESERMLERLLQLQFESYQAQNNNPWSTQHHEFYAQSPICAYYTKAQEAHIKHLVARLNNCKTLGNKVEQEKAVLHNLQSKAIQNNHQLQQKQVVTQQLLPQINKERTETLAELNQKINEQKQLEKLLAKLRARLVSKPSKSVVNLNNPFSMAAGKLMLPIHLNKARLIQNAHSKFIVTTPEVADVHAIYPGRVIFANYLRGLGWLIILDHGKGYMSLYGNNQALHKKTGDWVNIDEKIATVAPSTGKHLSGLYFEIRKDGRVLNPLKWIQPA